MAGAIRMPVSDRIGRIGTFEPESIILFLERDSQHDMVELGGHISRKQLLAVRADKVIPGVNSGRSKQGFHIVGKGLAVSEAAGIYLGGFYRLHTANAEGNILVSGGLPEIIIEDLHFLEIGLAAGSHILDLCDGRFRQHVPTLSQSVYPLAERRPVFLVSGISSVGKIYRRRIDIRKEFQIIRHVGLVDQRLEIFERPLMDSLVYRILARVVELAGAVGYLGTERDGKSEGSVLHKHFVRFHRKECRERNDSLLEFYDVIILHYERIRCRRRISEEDVITDEAGHLGYRNQVLVLQLGLFSSERSDRPAEGSQFRERVRIFPEDRTPDSVFIQDSHGFMHAQLSGNG